MFDTSRVRFRHSGGLELRSRRFREDQDVLAHCFCFYRGPFVPGTADALKDVTATIPRAARIGDTVTLQCRYDLEGEPLYTVKWYKGKDEFFRYVPKEMPSTQIFPLPGINVDVS